MKPDNEMRSCYGSPSTHYGYHESIKTRPRCIGCCSCGLRAKGTRSSNSDIDIDIYNDSSYDIDLDALQKVAVEIDDDHRENLITKINEWGNWVNGGGWLVVQGSVVGSPAPNGFSDLEI